MVKLQYDLDAIKESPYVPDKCLAELRRIKKTTSKAGNPMLQFDWHILSGPNTNKEISSYAALLHGSGGLDVLYMHLEALGVKVRNGQIEGPPGDEPMAGRRAILMLGERPSTKEGRTEPFIGVERVMKEQR